MNQKSYEQIDDLFVQIRLRLLKIRQSDPETAEELKTLLTQLEDCVESQVIEYLKSRSQGSTPRKATKPK